MREVCLLPDLIWPRCEYGKSKVRNIWNPCNFKNDKDASLIPLKNFLFSHYTSLGIFQPRGKFVNVPKSFAIVLNLYARCLQSFKKKVKQSFHYFQFNFKNEILEINSIILSKDNFL